MTVVAGDRRQSDQSKLARGRPSLMNIKDDNTRRLFSAMTQTEDYLLRKVAMIKKRPDDDQFEEVNVMRVPKKTSKIPSVSMISATWDNATGATLVGNVNPLGGATQYYFQYMSVAYDAANDEYPDPDFTSPTETTPASAGSGSIAVEVTEDISGLELAKHYYVRLVAVSANGKSFSNIISFDTCNIPDFAFLDPTEIKPTGAKLHGTVNPKGLATTAWFVYGINPDCENETPHVDIGDGTANVAVDATITGISGNSKVYYRLVAQNACGMNGDKDADGRPNSCPLKRSDMKFFFTLPVHSPEVETLQAIFITDRSAIIEGTVNPMTFPTTYVFDWGLTADNLSDHSVTGNAGSGAVDVPASCQLIGLLPDTEYFFRLSATNENGMARGGILSFVTNAAEIELAGDLAFSQFIAGSSGTEVKTITIKNVGDAPSTLDWSLTLTPSAGMNVSASATSGSLDYNEEATVNITLTKNGMAAGNYGGTVSVSAPHLETKQLSMSLNVVPLYVGNLKFTVTKALASGGPDIDVGNITVAEHTNINAMNGTKFWDSTYAFEAGLCAYVALITTTTNAGPNGIGTLPIGSNLIFLQWSGDQNHDSPKVLSGFDSVTGKPSGTARVTQTTGSPLYIYTLTLS